MSKEKRGRRSNGSAKKAERGGEKNQRFLEKKFKTKKREKINGEIIQK